MYRGLGFIEKSEDILNIIENLLPKIEEKNQEILIYEVAQLRKRTSESLRTRDFIYIFVSCPSCNKEHRIQASQTTIATIICKSCRTKFSIYYDDNKQEFYTNILEKPKIKTISRKGQLERDVVKYCARCGLKVGNVVHFCARCGLKILRN